MSKQILLVDDNTRARLELKAWIEESGYEVIEAVDGLDGLTKAKQYAIDGFIIDYKMPIINGINLIKNLKEMIQYQRHKMILMSTENSKLFQKATLNTLIDAIIFKPLDKLSLLEVLTIFKQTDMV